MDVMVARCAGLDVHKKSIVSCVLIHTAVESRQEIQTFGTTTAEIRALADWLPTLQVTHVAMESTGSYWKPLFNVLEDTCTTWLVNPAHIKAGPGRKTTVKDSAWIAQLLQHGLIQPSFIPDRAQRELHELTRYRKSVIEERAREANRIQKVLEGANIKLGSVISEVLGVSGTRILRALAQGETDPAQLATLADDRLRATPAELARALDGLMGPHQQFLLTSQLQHLTALDQQIATLDAEVERRLAPLAATQELIESHPGIGDRGLTGVDLVVSDDHRGLRSAIEQPFQGASGQRCQTHLTRNVLDAAPKAVQDELHRRLRSLFEAPDRTTVDTLWDKLLQDCTERAPRALAILEDGLEDALAVLQLPAPLRQRLRTTNGVERLNAEIRRRERVIRIFPNRDSAIRLLGAVLLEQHEAWITGKRYLDLEPYWTMKRRQAAAKTPAETGAASVA